MLHALGLGALGAFVGVLGTLIGAGGGFVLLPILMVIDPHASPAQLTAMSLAVVCANATSGSIAYARLRRIDVRAGLVFALAGLPGAIAGALLAERIPHAVFDRLLGGVMVAAAGFILLSPPRADAAGESGSRTLVERDGTVHRYSPRVALGAVLSVGVGFLSSLLGIGGGVIHVPVMVYLLGFPAHIATATSHFVLAILALSGVVVHATTGTLQSVLDRTLPLVVGALLGAQAGAWASTRVEARWIMRGLAAALAAVGVRLLLTR